jgi:hypothetical protein
MNERHWLAVACRNHVRIGVGGGFAQVCHGRRGPLSTMRANDWLIYYSPGHGLGERGTLKAFTALGRVVDNNVEQVRVNDEFIPWRRSVQYETKIVDVAVAELKDRLALTQSRNWGYSLRRGLLPLASTDFEIISLAMRQPSLTTNTKPS